MASTTFVDGTTVVQASWLNDVNTVAYTDTPSFLLEWNSVFKEMSDTQVTAVRAAAESANAECSVALQSSMDARGLNYFPNGTYVLSAPLRRKSGEDRVFFKGDTRILTILVPNATSISVAPVSVNALIINQDNNAHFGIENMRFFSTVGYTGVAIYCKEGGGADATAQALFSGVFRNLWIDFPTTNTGFLTGATQNTVFDTITCENMKGIFTIEGVGNSDNHYKNFSLYNCYDQFILQTADTNGSFILDIDGLNVYSHNRGKLFNVQNWKGANISNIILEPKTGNLGDVGIGKWKDCTGLQVSNFYALTRTGVPASNTCLEFDTSSGKYMNGAVNADKGLRISGTGAIDLEFVNVDFTNCTTAALEFATAASGTLRTRGCKFNDSTINGILTTTANSISWYSYNDEFLNAGLGGSAGARNITLQTSGTVVLTNPRIGQNNGSAAAAYYIDASGSGTVTLVNPIWIGTPPTGRTTGSQAIDIQITQGQDVTTVTDATYTVLTRDGAVIANRAGTVTLTLPNAVTNIGKELLVRTIQAQTVISASANIIPITGGSAATAILAATDGAWALLKADGTNWQIMAASV